MDSKLRHHYEVIQEVFVCFAYLISFLRKKTLPKVNKIHHHHLHFEIFISSQIIFNTFKLNHRICMN